MGKARQIARDMSPDLPHHEVLEDFRDQLLIVLLKRVAVNGQVSIPISEVDHTEQDIVMFSVADGAFHFELRKKA